MAQLHLYVPEDVAEKLREEAEARGISLSKYLAYIVQREAAPAWPEDYFDSSACIHVLNGTSERLVAKLASHHPQDIRTSAVVVAELYYGAHVSSRVAENLRAVTNFLAPFVALPFDAVCAEAYAQIRAELKRRGEPIGATDLFIAATAVAHALVLVTHNVREFSRVPGLSLEDWEASPL